MIFKKPYAFLIKHFKLIHLALTLLTIYILRMSYNIYIFLNDYVKNNYTLNSYDGFSDIYVPFLLFFSVIVVIITLILIILLFKDKKKPSKYYEITLIYYLIAIIMLIVAKSVLSSFETSLIEAETARIYRDIAMIFLLPQVPIIIYSSMRALGFNVRKFNFQQDLKDLNITEKDDEEVEISFNYETYKVKRVIRRFFREFKYYIKENKFIFICICSVLIFIFGYLIISNNTKSYNNNYKQNEAFVYKGLVINIKDSIVTNLDYKGDIIDDNYYLVLQAYIENNTSNDIDLKSENLKLKLNNNFLYPVNDKSHYFVDYAGEYYGKTIPKNTKNNYAIVYKLKEEEIKNSYKISIYKGSINKKKEILDTFDYIKLNPVTITDKSVVTTKKVGEEINFNNTNLINTKITINKYTITNQYVYEYQSCITKNDCRTFKDYINISHKENDKILLVLDLNYKIDKDSPFSLKSATSSAFIEKFAKVLYKDDDEKKYSNVVNVTPTRLKNTIILEVDKAISNSEEVFVSFIIRNKEFLIKLK